MNNATGKAMPESSSRARSFLRWAGSKRKLIPKLFPYWQAARAKRYIEPFVGSAAFFFSAEPTEAVLSDINEELIDTYRTVRDRAEDVAIALDELPASKRSYLRLRRQRSDSLPAVARAARFIFLNRFCFNGLYRTNVRGEFNVPYAPAKAGAVPDHAHLRAVAERLKYADLRHGDFESVVEEVVQPGDFVYLDPPFAVANRRIFRQYNATTFGFEDLHRVANLLYAIDALGATFVLSYAVCPESLAAFGSWRRQRVMTQRNIAGFAAHRRRAVELVITNLTY